MTYSETQYLIFGALIFLNLVQAVEFVWCELPRLKAERAQQKVEAVSQKAIDAHVSSGPTVTKVDDETQTKDASLAPRVITVNSSFFNDSQASSSRLSAGSSFRRHHHQPSMHRSQPDLHHVQVHSDSSDDDDVHNKTHHSIVDGEILGHHRRGSRNSSFDSGEPRPQ